MDSGTTAQSESSRKAGTSDECVVSVPENSVSPVHDAPVVVEQNVSTELPLRSNDAASTSEFDFLLQPFAIELFCGSAGLTATMRSLMPSSFGVDHSVIRPKSRVIQLNLLEVCNQKLVQEWALHPNCLWLHFGVPCGTASRAREIRLNQFAHGPPPLRDKRFPDGLPPNRLSAKNLLRVRSANRLYKFMMVLILMLPANKVWTIENPLRSWLWATSYIRAIKRRLRTFFGRFDMCMFGGKRFKKTGILTNCKHVMSFQATCDNRHKHIPFKVRSGKFDTSLEAEYPTRFCKVLTRAVAEHLSTAFGIKWNFQQLKSSQLAAVAAGKQPKGMPNLIHEFAAVVPVHGVPVDVDFPTSGKQQLKRCFSFVTSNEPIQVHKGAKLLRRTMKGGNADATEVTLNKSGAHSLLDLCNNPLLTSFPGSEPHHLPSVECNACSSTCDDCLVVRLLDNKPSCDVVFGIPWDPVEFTNEACDIGHPQNIVLGLLPEVRDAIKVVSETPVDQIVKERGQWFNKYVAAAKDLEAENKDILSCMPIEMRRIMQCKRLAVMKRTLEDHGYPDTRVVDDMASGFDLVGEAPSSSGVLPQKFTPANLHVDELSAGALLAREACILSTKSSGCEDTDLALWKKTLEERDKGWLIGPLDVSSLDPDVVISRRFPLQQGAKIRPIDDYSMSSVNATVGTTEQATTDSIDVISAMLAELMKQLTRAGRRTEVLARSFDLSAAYRQLCVAPGSYKFAHICVFDPTSNAPKVFRQVCLPFGSRSAVNAFIRCARCIQWIAAKCLHLPTTCYYDDFVVASTPELSMNSEASMALLLDLLGWRYDKEGPKSDTFSSQVMTLGVQFDLAETAKGFFEVCNTAKRKEDVLNLIDSTLSDGTMDKKAAQSLRGRLAFAYSQIFGLSGKLALQRISEHAFQQPFSINISKELSDALLFLRERIEKGVPRKVLKSVCNTFVILSDASFHSDRSGGIGGVLMAPNKTLISWFGMKLSSDSVSKFMADDQEVAIAELETLALYMCVVLWNDLIRSRHILFCLDNEVARYGLMKGYSHAPMVSRIVNALCVSFEEGLILPWFLRVPSSANIADFPSREMDHPFLKSEFRLNATLVKNAFMKLTRDLLHSDL